MRGDKPTPKQRLFAKAYIKNKFNATKSALEIYDTTYKGAKRIGNNNLKIPIVIKTIQEELASEGITMEYTNKILKNALEVNQDGKPSQAVLADLIKHIHKVYYNQPSGNRITVKQEYKVLLDKDYNTIRRELIETNTRTQELLNDLNNEAK